MKIMIRIFSVLLVLAMLIVMVSFFLPSKVQVERSKVISTSVENVFGQINNLKNWENWDSWHQKDPKMTLTYSDENPVGVRAWYAWKSKNNKVGSGKATIIESNPNVDVKLELLFGEMGKSMSEIKTERVENGTLVTMIFTSEIDKKTPVFKKLFSKYMFAFLMDHFIGDEYDKSLENLENYCKTLPEKPVLTYNIQEITFPAMNIISIKDSCPKSEMENKISSLYLELSILAAQNGINTKGSPFVRYFNWSENPDEMILIEPGYEVDKIITNIPKINCYELPSFKAIKTTHNGGYAGIKAAHDDLQKLMIYNQTIINGPVMEIFTKGPNDEKDSSNFVTEIIYPIQ